MIVEEAVPLVTETLLRLHEHAMPLLHHPMQRWPLNSNMMLTTASFYFGYHKHLTAAEQHCILMRVQKFLTTLSTRASPHDESANKSPETTVDTTEASTRCGIPELPFLTTSRREALSSEEQLLDAATREQIVVVVIPDDPENDIAAMRRLYSALIPTFLMKTTNIAEGSQPRATDHLRVAGLPAAASVWLPTPSATSGPYTSLRQRLVECATLSSPSQQQEQVPSPSSPTSCKGGIRFVSHEFLLSSFHFAMWCDPAEFELEVPPSHLAMDDDNSDAARERVPPPPHTSIPWWKFDHHRRRWLKPPFMVTEMDAFVAIRDRHSSAAAVRGDETECSTDKRPSKRFRVKDPKRMRDDALILQALLSEPSSKTASAVSDSLNLEEQPPSLVDASLFNGVNGTSPSDAHTARAPELLSVLLGAAHHHHASTFLPSADIPEFLQDIARRVQHVACGVQPLHANSSGNEVSTTASNDDDVASTETRRKVMNSIADHMDALKWALRCRSQPDAVDPAVWTEMEQMVWQRVAEAAGCNAKTAHDVFCADVKSNLTTVSPMKALNEGIQPDVDTIPKLKHMVPQRSDASCAEFRVAIGQVHTRMEAHMSILDKWMSTIMASITTSLEAGE